MPCRVDDYDSFEREKKAREYARMGVMLCAILKGLEAYPDLMNYLFDSISEREQGISGRAIRDWWEKHKEEDLARLARERRAALDESNRIESQIRQLEERAKTLRENAT